MKGAVKTTRAARRQVARDNANQPAALESVPREQWPANHHRNITQCWRSRDFLVQVYEGDHPDVLARLSVNRTEVNVVLDRWSDGITWDEMQDIKAHLGFGFGWAVEVYPAANRVVNVANLRHIWVLREAPPFAWQ